MRIEVLDGKDFGLLAKVGDGYSPDPRFSKAIVGRDGEEIVARVFLLAPVHVEGLWVREDKRNGLLLGRMADIAYETARKLGLSSILAFGMNATMDGYLNRLGFKRLEWSVWSREV